MEDTAQAEIPKKRSKREENREKSKELILRASLELFALKGYGSTTIEMIADRAGISRGLPYLYFDSKEKILHSILQRHFDREKMFLANIPKGQENPQEFTQTIIQKLCFPFREGTDSDECLEMRLILSMMLLPETKSIIQDWVIQFQSQVMETYFQDIKTCFSAFGIEDVETEMDYLRMIFFGYAFSRLCMGEDFPAEAIQKKIFDSYLERVKCRELREATGL